MPRKLRQLISDLLRAGFEAEPGKGSHRKFIHSKGIVVILSGKEGSDARHYQEKDLRIALKKAKE
ncbi:MAG: type II toxin-antitoxin system HicA family toxin [Opitutaceae bacterium]|jgi:predicted RNA binding protein YcfA (HicA-like mRNA interferase family)